MRKSRAVKSASLVPASHEELVGKLVKGARAGSVALFYSREVYAGSQPMLIQSPFNIALKKLMGEGVLDDEEVGQFASVKWLLFSSIPLRPSDPFITELDEHGMSEEDYYVEGEFDRPRSWAQEELNYLKKVGKLEEQSEQRERRESRPLKRRRR